MAADSVCAVVVTFHPTTAMLGNLRSIRAQVQNLVVVDNGSSTASLQALRTASALDGFHVVENGENRGIAEALNQGSLWAKTQGYPWIILFDQDSRITGQFIQQMFAAWRSHLERDRLASIHPRYMDPYLHTEPKVRRAKDGGPIVSMTSGALMPAWIFDRIGWFASDYFIDEVDTEYCLRIRAAGYLIADSKEAVLHHSAGKPQKRSFLGFSFLPSHHNSGRRYYISRNRVTVYRKYFWVFPGWILQLMNVSIRDTLKCLIAEEDRLQKFRSFLLGTWDGVRGRMGKRNEV